MVQIAKLTADLFANTSKFESGMKRARKTFSNFSKTVKTGAKAAGVAIGVATAALTAMGIRQAGVIDETAKLSAALGVNIRQFQALALVGSEAGITQEQIGTIITKSQRSILEAARGLQTYERSFKTLNLNAKELVKLSPEEQFLKITSALDKVDNSTVRTATALEIFGRSGRQVINMLGDMEGKMADALKFNDKFGISLNRIDASKVEEANDTFARVKLAVSGLGNVMAVEFAPVITAVSNAFLDSGITAESFGESVRKGMLVAAKAIDVIRTAVLGLKALYLDVLYTMDLFALDTSKSLYDLSVAMSKLPGLQEAGAAAAQFFLDANKGAVIAATKHRDAIKDLTTEAAAYESMVKKLERAQAGANERAKEATGKDIQSGHESITKALEEQGKASGKLSDKEKERIENAKELGLTFSSAFEKAISGGEKFSDVLQGIFTDIQNILVRRVVTEPLNDAITGLIGGIGAGAGGTDGGTAGTGIGGFFSNLFGGFRANGGPVSRGKSYIVGERGPELFTPGSSGGITANGNFGGGGLSVTINNNANAQVTAQERNTSNGRELVIQVERIVADGIGRKGSPINQSLKQQQSTAAIRR